MNEIDIIEKYKSEEEIYNSWGKFINDQIISEIEKSNLKAEDIIQISPKHRLKSIDSLIEKALYRDKNYKDAYKEITDKVGTRFVVLIPDQICIVKRIVESKEILWDYSLDRDYEEEKQKSPTIFIYQSVHYVVYNKKEFTYESTTIPAGIPCEIQIRTLLQHAYSQLTHDTIYKPTIVASPEVLRLVARSMALIETTDAIFTSVNEKMKEVVANLNIIEKSLCESYNKYIGAVKFEPKINNSILESLNKILKRSFKNEIDEFYTNPKNNFIIEIIKKKRNNLLYRQPSILLLYYMCNINQYHLKNNWLLPDRYLEEIFVDLGLSFDNGSNY